MAKIPEEACSIARTLGVLGERWTFLILREALLGATRFAEFRDRLGVAPDVLSDRLATLVEFGVMEREPYREPGARSRSAYRLTPAGRELQVVLSALQQWGDEHLPRPEGPSMLRRVRGTEGPVRVGYLDEEGREVQLADVALIPAGAPSPPRVSLRVSTVRDRLRESMLFLPAVMLLVSILVEVALAGVDSAHRSQPSPWTFSFAPGTASTLLGTIGRA